MGVLMGQMWAQSQFWKEPAFPGMDDGMSSISKELQAC